MPIPLLAAAASIAGGTTIAIGVSSAWSLNVAPYIEPGTYNNRLQAWRNDPKLIPEGQQLIATYLKGQIGPTDLRGALRSYGVDLPIGWQNTAWTGMANPRSALWKRYLDSLIPPAPLDIALRYYHLGQITADQLNQSFDLHGLAQGDARNYYLDPKLVPTTDNVLIGWQRGFVSDDGLEKYLKANGFTAESERILLKKLSYNWPTPTDLIPFAVKEVWDNNVVSRFQYDAEFPQVFQVFMDKQGLGWKPSDLGVNVPPEQDIPWPRAYWRAHWQMMSPTQAGHAVNFLRPDPFDPGSSRRPGIPPFTEKDFDSVLKIADYPPIIRQWLRGLSYLPLTRVDIRRMLKLGVIKKLEAVQLYRDLGYDQINSQRLADFAEEDIEQTKTSRERARLETIVRNLYLSCLYDKKEFMRSIYALRRPTAAKRDEFFALPIETQNNVAAGDANVSLLADALQLQRRLSDTKRTISAIRKAGNQGLINNDQTRGLLEQAGVKPDCIDDLMARWTLEGRVNIKRSSVSNILKWFIRGAMSAEEASYQLGTLGYLPADVARMMAIAAQDAALASAREGERLANTARKQRKAQEAILKEARAARNAVISDLNRSATKADILRVYRKGLIDRYEAYTAMIARGVLPREANTFLNEVQRNGQTQGQPPA